MIDTITLTDWLGTGAGRIVTWCNQSGISANLSTVGTDVWTSTTSPVTSLVATDQPTITAASPFPTFAGWTSTPNPGVSYVKHVARFEIPGTFTAMMWARQTVSNNTLRAVFSLGMWTTGILIRSGMVRNVVLANSALTTTLMPLNTWKHISLTRDDKNLVTLWISGSAVASSTVSGTISREPFLGNTVSLSQSV